MIKETNTVILYNYSINFKNISAQLNIQQPMLNMKKYSFTITIVIIMAIKNKSDYDGKYTASSCIIPAWTFSFCNRIMLWALFGVWQKYLPNTLHQICTLSNNI